MDMKYDRSEIVEVPCRILEALASEPLGGKARGACLYLISKGGVRIDKTGNPEAVAIPLKEWAKVLDCDREYVSKILNELAELGIIIRRDHLPGKVLKYTFERRVNRWARRSVKLPPRPGGVT